VESLIREVSEIRDVKRRRAHLKKRGLKEPEISRVLDAAHFLSKGRLKFPRAAKMRFDREGLAQASSQPIAEYRTWKMRNRLGKVGKALDVGSGIGGDTIFMAMRWRVVSVDRDQEKMEMLHHNLGVYNVGKNVETIVGDICVLLEDPGFREKVSDVDLVFFAPSRRSGGRRTVRFEEYEPPLSLVDRLLEVSPNLCVEVAPGADLSRIEYDCDVEVISHKGEVKEVILWFGDLKLSKEEKSMIATKLPERITRVRSKGTRKISVTVPKDYLYEPDPAFIKAGLIDDLAHEYGLTLLHPKIAYLTGEVFVKTPMVKPYRVLRVTEMDYSVINSELTRLNLGSVDSKARGVSIDHKEIRKLVRGKGENRGLVIFTLVNKKPSAIIADYL
jgi:hypothetical protein